LGFGQHLIDHATAQKPETSSNHSGHCGQYYEQDVEQRCGVGEDAIYLVLNDLANDDAIFNVQLDQSFQLGVAANLLKLLLHGGRVGIKGHQGLLRAGWVI
jgi:hypothetical protein